MSVKGHLWRLLALMAVCTLALQLTFVLRVALMRVLDPQSTAFQRSEAWRIWTQKQRLPWSQHWVDATRLSVQLKRAVIASEDAGFVEHGGIEWEAVQKAWGRNQRAQDQAKRRKTAAKLVGGSTISQQLAKNLFLSGERTLPRKAQEAVITLMLEGLLSKERLLEIYLNNVEWGEGVFGAQAAAQHYFQRDALRLDSASAAHLAVMLPAPKRYERNPHSAYLLGRAAVIQARMAAVELP